MGQKGDKLNNEATLAAETLVAQLGAITGITHKKMFGGHGIFHEGKMFGIVDSKGRCFLKADASNQAVFESKGSEKHGKMPYFSIPPQVMEDHITLLEWANTSIALSK